MKGRKRLVGLLMAMMVVVLGAFPAQASAYVAVDNVKEFGGAVDVQPVKTTVVGTEVEYNFRVSFQPILSNDDCQQADSFVIAVPAEATHTTITLVSTNSEADKPSPVAMQQVLNVQNVTQANFNNQTTSVLPLSGEFDGSKTYVATSDDQSLLTEMLGYPAVSGVKYYFVTSQQRGVVVLDVKTYLPEETAAQNGKVCIMAQEVAKAPGSATQAYRPVAASGAISLANYSPALEGTEGSATWFVVNRDQIGEAVTNGNYVVGSYDQHGIYNKTIVPTATGSVYEIGPDQNALGISVLNYIQEFHLHLNASVSYVATSEDLGDAAVLTYVVDKVTEKPAEQVTTSNRVELESLEDDVTSDENQQAESSKDGETVEDQQQAEESGAQETKETKETKITSSSSETANAQATTRTAGPNTGDASNTTLYLLTMLGAAGILLALIVNKKVSEK